MAANQNDQNTPDTNHNEQLLTQMAFTHIALDPQCGQFIEYLEAEKRALLAVMTDTRVRKEPALLQTYVGELIFCNSLLDNAYDRMAPDIAKQRERRSFFSGCKKFFQMLLTKKRKYLTPQS